MLFLIPPSETKAIGGGSINITQAHLTFGGLDPTRDLVLDAYIKDIAKKGGADTDIKSAPTMTAIQRYTGTLYSAIHGRGLKGTPTANNELTESELARARSMVLIQSALFGAIAATDLIPNYKISPSKLICGINLKRLWPDAHNKFAWARLAAGPVIDLRSKAYADLAPLPETIDAFNVTVFVERVDGTREQLNHFNKKAKGQLVRAALIAAKEPQTISELKAAAKKVGLKLEVTGKDITLITTDAT
jgi:cytoplasmic iron level regulating protein YaaA (DUF328/UPF0246 family)